MLVVSKDLVICFYLGWAGSILKFRQNIIKVDSKSWLITCGSNTTLSLPSYTGFALKRELNFCNGYLSLLYFWVHTTYRRAVFRFSNLIVIDWLFLFLSFFLKP